MPSVSPHSSRVPAIQCALVFKLVFTMRHAHPRPQQFSCLKHVNILLGFDISDADACSNCLARNGLPWILVKGVTFGYLMPVQLLGRAAVTISAGPA